MALTVTQTNNKLVKFTQGVNREWVRENLFAPYMGESITSIIRKRMELTSGGEQMARAERIVRGEVDGERGLVFGELADGEGVRCITEALAADGPRRGHAEQAELAGLHEGGARYFFVVFPSLGLRGDFGFGEMRDLFEEGDFGRR